MTRNVPKASESGMLRRGFFTSPAVKVMLFQASAEKRELVCATQMPTKRPNAVTAVRPGPTSCKPPRNVQKSRKFSAPAPDRIPTMMPRRINAMSAPVFAVVKTFWTSLPRLSPRVFMKVRSAIIASPRNCAVESEIA